MGQGVDQLKKKMSDIVSLGQVGALLEWDMQTYMPPGGGEARARQLSALGKLKHDLFVSSDTEACLDAAVREASSLPPEFDDACLVRVVKRDFDKEKKIPSELVAALGETTALAHEIWVKARSDNDFQAFTPILEKILALKIQAAECVGYREHIYDAFLDDYEPGLKTTEVETMFDGLRAGLVPLLKKINSQTDLVDDRVLHRSFEVEKQRAFAEGIVKKFGFDFSRGRQDASVHPFCTNFSIHDVRITTRFDPGWLSPAMFGTFHEAGHGMYEQGIASELEGSPLAVGASLGVHESQSRLWENIIGRSMGFWKHYFPILQKTFPDQLGKTGLDDFYRAINKVSPSFIRVEADEASYHLHVLLRFELEKALVSGKLKVKDLPEAWNAKFREYLDLTPPTDTLGVLQDVHWSGGGIGYFPTYSMGTLLSAQLFEKAVEAHPAIPAEIEKGEFGNLFLWLRENVHRHGRKFEPRELILKATGEPLAAKAWMKYLTDKLAGMYRL